MAEKIIVELDLKAVGTEQEFARLGENAKSAGKIIQGELTKSISEGVKDGSSRAISNLESLFNKLKLVTELVASTPAVGKGVFGFVTGASLAASSLSLISDSLSTLDNKLAQVISKRMDEASFIIHAFTAALTFGISAIGSMAFELGTRLVNSLQDVSKAALKSTAVTETFLNVVKNFDVVTGGAVGSAESWGESVDALSTNFNLLQSDLQKAAQEIILVGSQFGLNEKQLKKLLVVSAEYAKINNKEVFPVALAFVKALNGQSQAAQTLGVKLTKTAVAAFALKKGFKGNFDQLKDNEKTQIRYNKLLSQYSAVAGIAQKASDSLSDSQNRLNVQVDNLSTAFGQGVAIIENYNLVAFGLSKITETVGTGVVQTAGFFSALGARVLQITGFIVAISFKVLFLAKALTLLNVVLNSNDLVLKGLLFKIPILNKSISQLFSIMTSGRVTTSILATNLAKLGGLTGVLTSAFGVLVRSPITGTFTILARILPFVLGGFKALLILLAPFALIVAKIALFLAILRGAFVLVRNAIGALEERTGVFSETYGIMLKAFEETSEIFDPILVMFNEFKVLMLDIGQRVFGVVVAGIAKFVSVMAAVVASNPLGIFSSETVASFEAMEMKLDSFTENLVAQGFVLDEFSGKANRAVAGTVAAVTGIAETVDLSISDILGNFSVKFNSSLGKTKKSLEDFNKASASIVKGGIVKTISGGIQNIANSLAKGESVFDNFGNFLLGMFADLAIMLGNFFIAEGIAVEALNAVSGTGAIAAGVGLVALGSLIKAFSGGGGASVPSGGGASISSAGGSESLPQDSGFDVDAIEERQTSSEVNIVVEGSLVQQEELGSFITQIIGESNEKNNNVILNPRFA